MKNSNISSRSRFFSSVKLTEIFEAPKKVYISKNTQRKIIKQSLQKEQQREALNKQLDKLLVDKRTRADKDAIEIIKKNQNNNYYCCSTEREWQFSRESVKYVWRTPEECLIPKFNIEKACSIIYGQKILIGHLNCQSAEKPLSSPPNATELESLPYNWGEIHRQNLISKEIIEFVPYFQIWYNQSCGRSFHRFRKCDDYENR
ncbi:hypothetical protein Glove_140g58 [Diversispora epigaea]|uniref:Uncharacterized protein n=1 Tax=Diversispora epigaea TaxID=1348612 RepID=A0A397J3T0_9GLOM|nr:hypothetical protein Glove_140g58 [Diversispora epigaea]